MAFLRRVSRRLLRPLLGLALLVGLVIWLEPAVVLAEVQRLSPGWALLALALTLPPLALSAWRWRLTARLLGLSLGIRRALAEYALALFLNQVLPGGVAGDATRAWRHARTSGRRGGAWRAVIIERASGQLAMALLCVVVLVASPLWHELMARAAAGVAASGWLPAVGVVVLLLVVLGWRFARHPPAALAGLGGDLRRSLLAASVWPKQLGGSLLVVVSYALVFVCAARAIGVSLPLATLLALVPPVLLAMLIPLSVAGWGVREGAAALVWGLAGLPPAQGVAVSLAYGVVVLVASLPGALVLLQRLAGTARGRAGDAPGGSGGGRLEVEVEEGVVAAAEGAGGGAARLGEGGDGRHREPRPARADQQRRHQQVQPMQHAGLQETRHRDAAALDQHALEALVGQRLQQRRRGEAAAGERQRQARHVGRRRTCRARPLAMQVQGGRFRVPQHTTPRRHPAAGVEQHPHRLGAADMAHRELGVVGLHGAGAHHHGIHQGAQAVQVHQALWPVDVVGVATLGGDAPVEALAELGDGQSPGAGRERGEALQQLAGLGRDGPLGLPAGRGKVQAGHRGAVAAGMGGPQQGLPGLVGGEQRVAGVHGASCRRIDPHHAHYAVATPGAAPSSGESDASG